MNKSNINKSILSFPIIILFIQENVLILGKHTMKDLRDIGGIVSNLLSNVLEKCNMQICTYGEKMIQQMSKM